VDGRRRGYSTGVPRRPPLTRRLATVARWPTGVGLTSWRYLWRTTPLHRSEEPGTAAEDACPALPPDVPAHDLQRPEDGVGALFHRRYRARIREASATPGEVMAALAADPDRAAPSEFATFQKTRGTPGGMSVGDEYVVRMPGPWNGPVRVVEVTPTSFRLATLAGHLEAGQIAFRASRQGDHLVVEIESWASSGDRLSRLLYQHLRMSKEIQLHMWTSFLERVARMAGGRLTGGVEIRTRRLDPAADAKGGLTSRAARRALEALREEPDNVTPEELATAPPARGWRRDDRRQALPPEAPGEPEPGGSFEVARRLVRDYEFSDPARVRATFDPDEPLEGRVMLLELRYRVLRFQVLRFLVGVRVTAVYGGPRRGEAGPAQVWGWSYRTLRGHLEAGERSFEVWKWTDTGAVEFRTHAVSRAASRNPLVRLGFRWLGRRRQAAWVRSICERMARLTAADLASGGRVVAEAPRGPVGLVERPVTDVGRIGHGPSGGAGRR
jgi:uncharacterized protein (UPF0548 family)